MLARPLTAAYLELGVPYLGRRDTQAAWLVHAQVRPGDETIGCNPATGRSEWTRILRVVHHDDAEVWRIGYKHWHANATPNHRWWSDTLARVQPAFETCPERGWVPRGARCQRAVSRSTG
jgi:hypothetical protein